MCRSDTSETKNQQKRHSLVPPWHIFSPTVSPCLVKGKHSSFPYPLTPTKPAFTVVFYPFYLSPILSIVSYLSPPPLSFAIFSLHIEYLLFVLLGSVVVRRLSICTNLYECAFPCYRIVLVYFHHFIPQQKLPHQTIRKFLLYYSI